MTCPPFVYAVRALLLSDAVYAVYAVYAIYAVYAVRAFVYAVFAICARQSPSFSPLPLRSSFVNAVYAALAPPFIG